MGVVEILNELIIEMILEYILEKRKLVMWIFERRVLMLERKGKY